MTEENLGSFTEEIIEDKTFRNWMILLYEDTTSYVLSDILFNISSLKDYAYIKHYAESDEKKDHYHVYIELSSATTQERLAKRLGIPPNFIKRVKSRRGACRYLTHIDYPNKIQYDLKEVFVSRNFQRKFLLNFQDMKTEDEILNEIYTFITTLAFKPYEQALRQLVVYVNENCYDSIYKRYRFEFNDYLKYVLNK